MDVPKDYIVNIKQSLKRHGLSLDGRFEEAIQLVPRQLFVGNYTKEAYKDRPLPIPKDQTISAPHMYAMMLSPEIASIRQGMDILEIGTGSGYGAALLAKMVTPGRVVSIERHLDLVNFALGNVSSLNLQNLRIKQGDGTNPEIEGSFDRIIITASGPRIPPVYYSLLREGGRIIMPLERGKEQWLTHITYPGGQEKVEWHFRVRFVPLIGRYGHS